MEQKWKLEYRIEQLDSPYPNLSLFFIDPYYYYFTFLTKDFIGKMFYGYFWSSVIAIHMTNQLFSLVLYFFL